MMTAKRARKILYPDAFKLPIGEFVEYYVWWHSESDYGDIDCAFHDAVLYAELDEREEYRIKHRLELDR